MGTRREELPTSAACCAAGEDVVVLDVFRSPLWSSNGQEDVLKVEILRSATVGKLRALISELYGHSEADQRLQRTPELGGKPLRDSMLVAELVHKPIFLFPSDIDAEEVDDDDDDDDDYEPSSRSPGTRHRKERTSRTEQEALVKGVVESLQGVTYNVHIAMPDNPTSKIASRSLRLDAMSLVGDVQVMLEVEMTGSAGRMPMLLVFNGQALPPEIPLHFAGVRDGDTLAMVLGGPGGPFHNDFQEDDFDDEDDEDDDPVANWVNRS
jgi:hypothetical protein